MSAGTKTSAQLAADEQAAFRKKRTDLDYLFDAVRFIAEIEKSTSVLCNVSTLPQCVPHWWQLLSSKTSSDVLECIHFFVAAHEFRLSSANVGVRRMLVLVWSKELPIQEA